MSNFCYHGKFVFRCGYNRKLIFPPQFIGYFLPFSTTVSENPPPKNPFMVDYLINSCGFSMKNAVTVSTNLTRITSPKKPNSVLRFLKQHSFNDAQIKRVISLCPRLLFANVDKTLKPKFKVFQDLGLSGPDLADLFVRNPLILRRSVTFQLLPCISQLRTILSSDEYVIKVIKKFGRFLGHGNMNKSMLLNISILQRSGVSNHNISNHILKDPWIITQPSSRLEEVIEKVEKMGVSQDSGAFPYAIRAISAINKSTLDTKFQIFKSYGWSETDILSAFQKHPSCLLMSESKIRKEMDFFMGELKYRSSYIANHPTLLKRSLETVIIPRYNVVQLLKSKNLIRPSTSFSSIALLGEKKFKEKYVLQHMDKVPGVFKAYESNMGDHPSPAT